MTTNLDDPSVMNNGATPQDDGGFDGATKTTPLMAGAGSANLPEIDDFESEPARNGRSLFNQSTMLILLLLGVAAALIYTMRVSQGEISSTASTLEAEAKIDQALARLTSSQDLPEDDLLRSENLDEIFRDTDLIISMFSSDLTSQQVPIEYLQCNPFIVTLANSDSATEILPAAQYGDQRRKKAQQRMQELNTELAGLKLQTVIIGNVNVAVINDDLYQKNHAVGSFKVTKIIKMSVDLEADGQTFSLSMSQ